MKLTILSVGRDRSGLFAPAVTEYASRLSHVAKVQLIEIAESKASGDRARSDEAQSIIAKLTSRDVLVALDERGKQFSSVEFARWMSMQIDHSRDIAFAIGGDEGLGEEVRKRSTLQLSLSAMTLPHRLARVVLIEQIYRAFSIVRREPYHK